MLRFYMALINNLKDWKHTGCQGFSAMLFCLSCFFTFHNHHCQHRSFSMDHSSRWWHQLEWNLGINFGTNWNRCAWHWNSVSVLPWKKLLSMLLVLNSSKPLEVQFFLETGNAKSPEIFYGTSPEILPCKFPEIIQFMNLREKDLQKFNPKS